MTPEQWARWKNNSATKKFFKYLSDYREQTAREVAGFIAMGTKIDPDILNEATLRCQIMMDIEDLACEDITQFYKPEVEEETDVGENDRNRPVNDTAD